MGTSWKSSALMSAAVAIFFYATQVRSDDPSVIEAVSTTLFMFALAFLTMRITSRAVEAVMRRWGPKPPPKPERGPAELVPTSERIEHNRRRRDRQRRERRR